MKPALLTIAAFLVLGAPGADAQQREGAGASDATAKDDRFEIALGGRIHIDAYAFDRDLAEVSGTTEFRRARLTVSGRLGDWDFKLEQDFAAGNTAEGFRDVYVARKLFGGKLTIGHFKPYRSMEELTSSNEVTMMERPFASASGLYGGRQFQQGVGYLTARDRFTAGVSVFNLRNAAGPANEGVGAAARLTMTPLLSDQGVLHLGISLSHENANRDTPDLSARAAYAGRRGPSRRIATTAGASGGSVDAVGLELAGTRGPWYFQSEFARARFDQATGSAQRVETWYLMGSWMITGEHKPYKRSSGVFGSVRPQRAGGAWELTARLDSIENGDTDASRARSALLGLNWYPRRNLRVMFNYTRGDDSFSGDRTAQFALRTQLSF